MNLIAINLNILHHKKRISIKSEIVGAKFDLTLKSFPNLHKLSF